VAERGRPVRIAALALTFALGLAPACGTRVSALYEKVLGSPTYDRITRDHTRTREVHDGLEARFILKATWLSPRWVRAFTEEYSNIYYLDGERRDRVVARWSAESEAHVRFFVALFTPEEEGNDMEREGTLWSLHLVRADEVEFRPAYVRKSSLRPEEVDRFFPYSGVWYRSYEVAFPKEAGETVESRVGSSRLKLVLTGVRGRAVLVW